MKIVAGVAAILAVCGVTAGAATTALAQPASSSRGLTIPAGPLGAALNQFARNAGVVVTYDPALVSGKTTRGVSAAADATPAQTLDRLLRDAGLRAQADGAGGFVIAPAAAAGPIAAQRRRASEPSRPAPAAPDDLSELVVTASRTGSQLDSLPLTVSVVDQATLTRQLRQNRNILTSLEAAVPGLSIQNADDRTACGSRIRGRQASFQVNGVPVNEDIRQGSCTGPFTVAPFAVERVEVVRGGSALYGAGAPGGIINLVTRRAKSEALEIDLTAQTGFNTAKTRDTFTSDLYAGMGRRVGAFDYYVGAGYTDGGRQRDPDGRPVPSADFNAVDLIGAFGLSLPGDSSLRLTTTFHNEDVGQHFAPDGAAYADTGVGRVVAVRSHPQIGQARDRNFTIAAAYANPALLGHRADVSVFYQKQTIRQRDNFYAAGFGDSYFASDRGNDRLGLRSTLVRSYDVAGGVLKTSYGADYSRNSFYRFTVDPLNSGKILNFLSPQVVLRTYAAFGQGEFALGAVTISGGVRQEWYRGDVTAKGYMAGVPGASVPGAIGKSDLTLLNLGAIWRLTDATQAYASFSQGAALSQLGRAARNLKNPGVVTPQPATSDQYEAGLRGATASLRYGAAVYYSRSALGAELTADPNCAGQVVCPLIPLRAPQRFHGVEANLDWTATPQLTLGGVLTWQRGKIYDADLKRFIEYSSNVAVPLRVTARADWRPLEPLSVGLQLTHYGAASYFSAAEQGLGLFNTRAVTVASGSVRYDLGATELYLTADNLLNARYLSPLSQAGGPGSFYYYRAQGRRLTVGASARF